MHKNEALPCPARLDPASHPVDTVGTQRVALGYARMGLRVEARKDTKALSTSCESTFIGLRKYIQQLMKALSKICCPCHQRTYTYFVGELLLLSLLKYYTKKGANSRKNLRLA